MPVVSIWILDKRSMAEGGASPAEIEAAAETARRDASALARLVLVREGALEHSRHRHRDRQLPPHVHHLGGCHSPQSHQALKNPNTGKQP